MTFDPNASLDPGQISDRRGMGRAGIPIAGGGLGLIVIIAYALLGGNPSDLGPILEPGGVTGPESSQLADRLPDGPGREHPRRLSSARVRQQRPGVLGQGDSPPPA